MLKDFTLYKYLSSTTIFLWGGEGGGIIKGRGVGLVDHLGYIHVRNVCVSVLTGACSL